DGAADGPRWELFQRLAQSPKVVWLPVAAAVADVVEDGIRLWLIWHAFRSVDGSAPTAVVGGAWLATFLKFGLLALSVIALLMLVRDCGLVRGTWGSIWWSIRRLRVAIGATLIYVALVVGDPTGQAADLIRRWLDSWGDALVGLSAVVGAAALGFTVWLITRRIVLANQNMAADERRPQERQMAWIWLAVVLVTAVGATFSFGWQIDRHSSVILIVAAVVLFAAMFLPGLTPTRRAAKVATDWRTLLLIATGAAWILSLTAHLDELEAPAA